jgi:hypothetical protein
LKQRTQSMVGAELPRGKEGGRFESFAGVRTMWEAKGERLWLPACPSLNSSAPTMDIEYHSYITK